MHKQMLKNRSAPNTTTAVLFEHSGGSEGLAVGNTVGNAIGFGVESCRFLDFRESRPT